jgi:hypothetical protein
VIRLCGGSVRRRLTVSFLMALGLFLTRDFATYIAPAPERALANLEANSGGILYLTAMMFVVYGCPSGRPSSWSSPAPA